MSSIQEQFDSVKSGDFVLTAGEYEGPLRINRPCIVDGSKSTLWATRGPVLLVDSPNVTIKDIRIEVTGNSTDADEQTAIKANYADVQIQNVGVNGMVVGLSAQEEAWNLPAVISLGAFAANKENVFSVEIDAAASAELVESIRDVNIHPLVLQPGNNRITIETTSMRDNTILYGEILVKTAVIRRIYVTGKAQKDAPEHHDQDPIVDNQPISNPVQIEPPHEVIAPIITESNVEHIKRGQRISLKEAKQSVIKVAYEQRGIKQAIDIDGYAFELQANGKVRTDSDLIFFGNPVSQDNAVRSSSANNLPLLLVEPNKLDNSVEKVAICFSIYGDDITQNFSLVDTPIVRVFADERELYRYRLDDLKVEKTVVAVEFYRYKGDWKISFVGAGYRSGLKQLCESFGVNVE
ncbi:MAG: hypothetical protein EOM45_01225 [Clostridia bacterium]|nr:hypothetical protein [Clostridia bacterium]